MWIITKHSTVIQPEIYTWTRLTCFGRQRSGTHILGVVSKYTTEQVCLVVLISPQCCSSSWPKQVQWQTL